MSSLHAPFVRISSRSGVYFSGRSTKAYVTAGNCQVGLGALINLAVTWDNVPMGRRWRCRRGQGHIATLPGHTLFIAAEARHCGHLALHRNIGRPANADGFEKATFREEIHE
jgi:hypothetical protein